METITIKNSTRDQLTRIQSMHTSKWHTEKSHEIAFVSILKVTNKATFLFGKTLIIFAFNAIRCVISSYTYITVFDSVENQISNFIGGLIS